jgi:hypothetical protein
MPRENKITLKRIKNTEKRNGGEEAFTHSMRKARENAQEEKE